MRSYNDRMDETSRQDLYKYAARVVDTRTDAAVERHRAKVCVAWARACCHTPELRVRILHRLLRWQGPDVDGVYAARAAAVTPDGHDRALAFLDELIGLPHDPGSRDRRSASPWPPGTRGIAPSTSRRHKPEGDSLTLSAESAGAV
jgi:hypothetical protein